MGVKRAVDLGGTNVAGAMAARHGQLALPADARVLILVTER